MAVALARSLGGIRLFCRDPAAVAAFYIEALGFSRLEATASHGGVALTLGDCRLDLAPLAAGASGLPVAAPGWSVSFQHFAIAVSSMQAAFQRLQDATNWTPISAHGPQRLPASSGGVTAYKFRDPDGHPLELLAFPNGETSEALPRIDHSAISVADTATSVRFYERLGFAISTRTLNHGPEQDQLDGLENVSVEVTALTIPHAAGPHLELLCYLGDYPRVPMAGTEDSLASTRLLVTVADRDLLRSIAADYCAGAASDPQTLLLRDPDGHVLQMGVVSIPASR